MAKPTYYEVLTWDMDRGMRGAWTPQKGVRRGPYSRWGLRKALRKLQGMGYETRKRSGYSVLISAR